jgi:hypothetical protein
MLQDDEAEIMSSTKVYSLATDLYVPRGKGSGIAQDGLEGVE